MTLAYILSFLGMLSWQWGVHNLQGMAGKIVGIILLAAAVIKTLSAVGGRYADKKELLFKLGVHAFIWIAGMFLYDYIIGLLIIAGMLIGINIFGNFSFGQKSQNYDERGTDGREFDISHIPVIVYDDGNRQWKRRDIYGDRAVYYNDNGEEVTIYSAQISGNTAHTSAGTLHWY